MEIITFPKEPKNGNSNRNANNKSSNNKSSNNKGSNNKSLNNKDSNNRKSNSGGVKKTPPRKQNELKLDILEVDDFFDCKRMVENARKPSKSANNSSRVPNRPRSASERDAKRRRRRKKVYLARTIFAVFIFILLVLIILLAKLIMDLLSGERTIPQGFIVSAKEEEIANIPKPDFEVNYLPVNEYSRPGDPLKEVKNVFIHYTGNRGTTGWQNRSYFENLAVTQETSASAHFVIGYEGEIIQCIPFEEIGYAVIGRNEDSISIECCYLDENGKFTDATYQSAIKMTAWLLDTYNLNVSDVLRHYDATGKECPKYYVDHPEEWEKWKDDLTAYIKSL